MPYPVTKAVHAQAKKEIKQAKSEISATIQVTSKQEQKVAETTAADITDDFNKSFETSAHLGAEHQTSLDTEVRIIVVRSRKKHHASPPAHTHS